MTREFALTPSRRGMVVMAGAAGLALSEAALANRFGGGAQNDLSEVRRVVAAEEATSIKRLQDWIALPSIAAEDRNAQEGAARMVELLKDAGFQTASIITTKGKPGVFAKLDAGARHTTGMYFMYDVKQFDPAEWSSPPLEGKLVTRPGLGTVMIGRGAINQKGPQATFLSALHALRTAGRKSPVNIVLVAEGEEEIGSPNIGDIVLRPDILRALRTCGEVWTPSALQGSDGAVKLSLGNKGLMEVELTCSGARWGRGPAQDIHSMYKAEVDSPVWRLVAALATLVSADGNDPAIDGWFENVRPLTVRQRQLVAESIRGVDEERVKRELGVGAWMRGLSFAEASERLVSQPTVNIEGMYAGHTGPGGKTVLPAKAVAKLDFRLVPDQTAQEAKGKLLRHLAARGFSDIDVNVTGAYDPSQTPEDARVVTAAMAVYREMGIPASLSPRSPGSNPSFIFTQPPVSRPRGHFGLGHGGRLHAPDEYYLIRSDSPKLCGLADATLGYVRFLYQLAAP